MEKDNFNEQERICEKVLLVGVDDGTQGENFERSMEELKSLAQACFMEPVGVITQRMESINKGLYIGTGKVQEVKEASQLLNADVIIFDDALTPSQLRNLQNELEKPILDRTTLILDIFESNDFSLSVKFGSALYFWFLNELLETVLILKKSSIPIIVTSIQIFKNTTHP